MALISLMLLLQYKLPHVMLTVREAELRDKSVLLFVDYNVAVADNGIGCTYKIDRTIQTIDYVLSQGCCVLTLCTFRGRPGKYGEYPLAAIHRYLKRRYSQLGGMVIGGFRGFAEDASCCSSNKPQLYLTDNFRYYTADEMSEFCRIFDTVINDAFACAHRTAFCQTYAGLLMEQEIKMLGRAKRADLIVMGGAKMSDKLAIMESFRGKVVLGGLLAQTVFKSVGYCMGRSKCEEYDPTGILSRLHVGCDGWEVDGATYQKEGGTERGSEESMIILPVDFLVRNKSGKVVAKRYDAVSDDELCVDIGLETVRMLGEMVKRSSCIFWNGPVGIYTERQCSATEKLVRMLSECGERVLCGGGDTLTAVLKYSDVRCFRHVSTGGGAMLQFLSGGEMPGVEAIYGYKAD